MERNSRITLQGIVISDKMDKTITVQVETHKRHAKYLKRVQYRNKYYAHDEKNEASVGDLVTIEACRPLSATKRFRLVSIDKKAVQSIKAAEAELALEEQSSTDKVIATEPKAEVKEEVKAEEVEAPKAPAKKAPAKKAAAKKDAE